jgi:hypothetical protein
MRNAMRSERSLERVRSVGRNAHGRLVSLGERGAHVVRDATGVWLA